MLLLRLGKGSAVSTEYVSEREWVAQYPMFSLLVYEYRMVGKLIDKSRNQNRGIEENSHSSGASAAKLSEIWLFLYSLSRLMNSAESRVMVSDPGCIW